nr:MAG TPA: hypothetical protein [Caudoviricetes sp.]
MITKVNINYLITFVNTFFRKSFTYVNKNYKIKQKKGG